MYEDLTKKQKEVLECIKISITENGFPPAIREICQYVNLKSTSSVHKYIEDLVEKGYLKKPASKKRAIEVVSLSNEPQTKLTYDIPIIGSVAAGAPILAEENIIDTFPIPLEYSHKGDLFILRVKGESMIEAGILDGDSIIVRQQTTAENGDIVVALIDDSATVKRFYKKEKYFELKPENESMSPIVLNEVEILGKVVGLFREI